jgi:hypothetical protein
MLTILGGLGEFERSLIKARTDVGIKRAREAGIKFGRPSKLTKHQQEQALKLLDLGEPQSAVALLLNVDQSTISRLASRMGAAKPSDFSKVIVDTTAQPKALAFPTDAKLMHGRASGCGEPESRRRRADCAPSTPTSAGAEPTFLLAIDGH